MVEEFVKLVERSPSVENMEGMLQVLRNEELFGSKYSRWLREQIVKHMPEDYSGYWQLYRLSLLADAPYDFDIYMQYMEIDRKAEERFYLPRRKILIRAVTALQELADDELDELFLSQPPRTGKTTLLLMFATWIIGRNSEMSNLYSAFSDIITSAFYSGILEILNDPHTYKWSEVFPQAKIVHTNSKEETINIDRNKRYPSITCRSLYGTLNGACDCNGFLITDDLIGGIEEALNPARMESAWSKVDNNLLARGKESAKFVWCGTRWSIIDPAGRRLDLLETDPKYASRRYKVVVLPALDENDMSNFDYDYGVGFSTEYYQQKRASFEHNNDIASWLAQYMQEPVEREGALFTAGGMKYFDAVLPERSPDRKFMAVDPAFGGGDFTASPVCYTYGEDCYVPDVVYDDGEKTTTIPLLVDAVMKWWVDEVQFATNKMTDSYKDEFVSAMREAIDKWNAENPKQPRRMPTVRSVPDSTKISKAAKIYDHAPDIREHFIFLSANYRRSHYQQFMTNVFGFTVLGKNKHDDAPDSLAMVSEMFMRPYGQFKIMPRLF